MRRPPESLMPRPVDKRARYQRIGGNGNDRIIEIPDFDDIQGDIGHNPVHIVLRHLYPVADTDHVVLRNQHSRDETQNGILEDQHQDGGKSAQSRNQVERRFVDQDGDDDDHGDTGKNHLEDLDKAFHRAVLQLLFTFQRIPHRIQYRIDGEDQCYEKIDPRNFLTDDVPLGFAVESERQQGRNHQGRDNGRQFPQYVIFGQRTEEADILTFQYPPGKTHGQGMNDSGKGEGYHDDQDQEQRLVQLIEHVPRNTYPREKFFDPMQQNLSEFTCIHNRSSALMFNI